jgi:hypothetical protein
VQAVFEVSEIHFGRKGDLEAYLKSRPSHEQTGNNSVTSCLPIIGQLSVGRSLTALNNSRLGVQPAQ